MTSKLVRLLVIVAVMGLAASEIVGQDTSAGISGLQIVFSVGLKPAEIQADDVRATAKVVARRLEALDFQPYVVQIVSDKAIQVQIPGIADPQLLIDTLTQTALLELVDFSGLSQQAVELTGSTILTTAWKADPNLPARDDGQPNPLTGKAFETILTGDDFVSVATVMDSNGQWTIAFELSAEAGTRFGDFTEAHTGEPLAIALDGQVISAPTIQARLGKDGVISGNFTEDQVNRLAAQLRAGVLPLPLRVKSIETIEAVSGEQVIGQ